MALDFAVLANGQLATTKGTLYTVPGSTVAVVKSIVIHNPGANEETITLYAHDGTASRVIYSNIDRPLAPQETLVLDEPFVLDTGDLLEGETTSATTVDYWISGEITTSLTGITLARLATGQVPDTATNVYTASGVQAIFQHLCLYNTATVIAGTPGQRVEVWLNNGSNNRKILDVCLQGETPYYWRVPIILEDTHSIRMVAETANTIDYWISGAEIS